jgi:hypothetical protein
VAWIEYSVAVIILIYVNLSSWIGGIGVWFVHVRAPIDGSGAPVVDISGHINGLITAVSVLLAVANFMATWVKRLADDRIKFDNLVRTLWEPPVGRNPDDAPMIAAYKRAREELAEQRVKFREIPNLINELGFASIFFFLVMIVKAADSLLVSRVMDHRFLLDVCVVLTLMVAVMPAFMFLKIRRILTIEARIEEALTAATRQKRALDAMWNQPPVAPLG